MNIIKSTINKWVPILDVDERGNVITKNNKIIKIIEVFPINFSLKSDMEKQSILNSYKIFLKSCDFDIQILIQSIKKDLNQNIKEIKKNIPENKKIKKIAEEYINFINDINTKRESSFKKFYIIIYEKTENKYKFKKNIEIINSNLNSKYFEIKENLGRCGNSVKLINNIEEIKKILYIILNRRKYRMLNDKSAGEKYIKKRKI